MVLRKFSILSYHSFFHRARWRYPVLHSANWLRESRAGWVANDKIKSFVDRFIVKIRTEMTCVWLKARSHNLISRVRFLVPKTGCRRSDGQISRFCFCRHLSSFTKCRMKIKHVLFSSVFPKLRIHMSEGHFYVVLTIRFSEPTKTGSLKSDRVNGSSDGEDSAPNQ